MAQVWEIVGGSSRGGIIVREQVSLTSEREVDRLGTGSVVEEIKLVGDRLHYELLYGSGPVEGWVSIVLDSKVLAKRIADPRLHSSTKWAFPDSNFVHSVDLLKKQRASSTKALPDKQPLQTRDKFSEILREEDVLTELDGFPLNRLLPEAEVPDFCKMVVPAWRSLPSGTTWKSTTLAGGNSSLVMLVATDADMSPQRVVYVFNGSADTSSLEPILLSIAASKSGAAPKLYAAIGKHRVMEFVDADQTFGGAFVSHFLAMPSDTTWPGNFHDGPGNPHLMGHIGRAVGLVHALPLDFLQKALLPPDFFNRMSNPLFYPLAHAQFMPVVKDLADKVASSKAIPRSGFFQWPVICHGDLHGGNILSGLQDSTIIDWESVCLAHRGIDLAYFFLCAPGATLESRRAFASAYISVQPVPLSSEDDFLLDVERCIPLGLVHMALLSVMVTPPYTPGIKGYAKAVLEALEAEPSVISVHREDVLRKGILRFIREKDGST